MLHKYFKSNNVTMLPPCSHHSKGPFKMYIRGCGHPQLTHLQVFYIFGKPKIKNKIKKK